GQDRYVYSFNELGNMMKIVTNNESKKFVYNGNQIHAPSQIIQGSAGIDIYKPNVLDSGNKNKTIEFFLVNDDDDSLTGVNYSIDFGDGKSTNDSDLNVTSSIMMFIEHDYDSGGEYEVEITASSDGISDEEILDIQFGINAERLQLLYSLVGNSVFEFIINNDLDETAYDVNWNCSEGISSAYGANLTGDQSLLDYLQHQYTSAGDKTFTCDVISDDGTDSLTEEFTVRGLEIENYDVLMQDISRRIVSFDLANYFDEAEANLSVNAEMQNLSIGSNERIMSFVEVNYSEDGTKTLLVEFETIGDSDIYTDTFTLEGASIENYQRTPVNYTTQVIAFDVVNNWHDGEVNWSIEPIGISDSTNLSNNARVLVIIEENYTSYGEKTVSVTAKASTVTDLITDYFVLTPIEILNFLTLAEGQSSTVFEILVKNNMPQIEDISYTINDGVDDIVGTDLINISDETFIFVETEYADEGIHRTLAVINSTNYDDNETGVVII
ncbi:MAG: hypothetical protein KKF44_06615, partial [Nanoarchaeota archaeon]|nr:hypothetical protein [Nanoarchaeota archaeon]